ncbi:hypothetical protein [Gemmobacter sp. 24YEA27]|uniref:hypothetical protein n=1 Tax=Gemmobacter sp. 24YEA27 TaxID=3040672 RepID=UPI0024B33681|nr:hypothetical protein [Gemmobacter sp. 24YEA27]
MTDTVLRVIGTPATLTPELRARAAADLPFGIQFEVLDGLDCQRRGVMAPESFDVYDQWFHSLDLLWTAASIRPIDTTRLARWDEVTIAGTRPGANGRQPGSWPGSLLYAQSDRSLAAWPQPGEARKYPCCQQLTTWTASSGRQRCRRCAARERPKAGPGFSMGAGMGARPSPLIRLQAW